MTAMEVVKLAPIVQPVIIQIVLYVSAQHLSRTSVLAKSGALVPARPVSRMEGLQPALLQELRTWVPGLSMWLETTSKPMPP